MCNKKNGKFFKPQNFKAMENLSEKLKAEIIAYVDKHQPEYYFDYRDGLTEQQVETIFSSEDGLFEVENEIFENNFEYECELKDSAVDSYIDYFEDEITEEIGEDRPVWEDDFRDWVQEYVWVDMNIRELMRNTGEEVFFLDTGEEFTGYGQSQEEYEQDCNRIKKLLGITSSKYDDAIMDMIYSASYGGQLAVYFNMHIDDLLDNLIVEASKKQPNAIRFKNAHIAIIDTVQGSGWYCELPGHEFTLPFQKESLFYERSVSYNFTYDVCGMSSNWCDSTRVAFISQDDAGPAPQSSLAAIKAVDDEYERMFKAGKCTLGDKKFSRHRNVIYVNNFPCGHECQDCGQFWVD